MSGIEMLNFVQDANVRKVPSFLPACSTPATMCQPSLQRSDIFLLSAFCGRVA